MRIDFNCDLGEGCGDDAAIVPLITSASIACGAHAGDETSMRATLRLCRTHGDAAGAHPSFEDRANFGRRELALAPGDIHALVQSQLERLSAVAADEGVRLAHVKPHGALYNLAARDRDVATAIAAAIAGFDPALILFGLSGSELTRAGEAAGLAVAHEVFAERRYDADGRLAPRGTPGAVIESLEQCLDQVRQLLGGRVTARGGQTVALRADTLCLHGDRADAADFAHAIRSALQAQGVRIQAVGTSE